MDEKMVICPKAKECGDECFYPIHKTPHKFMVGSCAVMTAGHACPACIPVPSTPASVLLPPDELLTERDLQEFIEGTLVLAYMEGQANSNASATKLAKEIIAKCRQSEAAKIKQLELGKKLSMESDNRIEQAIGKVLGYPAYKDDQKNFPNATEANGVCVGDHVAESLVMELVDRFKAIRADQTKKIGEWGNEPCPHRNNDFPFPKAVPTELQMLKRECRDCWQEKSGVAKLQKGESPE